MHIQVLQSSAATDLRSGGHFNTTFVSNRHENTTHSLTHCCAWPAEGRSVLHIERSWPAIRAAPTDMPMSSSTCCSQFLRGRPGGRFQSAAGGVPVWASIDSCSACEAGVFSGRRQMWPNNEWRLSFSFILSLTTALGTLSYHLIPRIRRSACMWKDWILSLRIQQWTNYKNRPKFAKVIAKIKVAAFLLRHIVYLQLSAQCQYVTAASEAPLISNQPESGYSFYHHTEDSQV